MEVVLGGIVVARTTQCWRVLETSHPPTYYLPAVAFAPGVLRDAFGSSWCEWKGAAENRDLVACGRRSSASAWIDPDPSPENAAIGDLLAFSPPRVDECRVGDDGVTPNARDF